MPPDTLPADLVLEGGGVKGVGLAGAVTRLGAAGYAFQRIAGSSAGAVAGALVAALARAGEPVSRVGELALAVDYRRFRDRPRWQRLTWRFGDAVALLTSDGVWRGDYLHDWLAGTLADLGVRTFGDLRLPPDPESDLPEEHRYRLVVTATDVSRQRLARLPWDFGAYGLDPDEQPVAGAVRASASIPYLFQPVRLRARLPGPPATLVDGGVVSNFPVALFDRSDGKRPRWPTFGVRLAPRSPIVPATTRVRGPVALTRALVETALEAGDAADYDTPCVRARSVFVDPDDISAFDFSLSETDKRRLYDAGTAAATGFLATWHFAAYVARCRAGQEE